MRLKIRKAVKPLDQYSTLKEFTDDIDAGGHHLPFRIMGKRRLPNGNFNGVYYTFSMLGQIHRNTPDPDTSPSSQSLPAPFGEILKIGCRLWGGSQSYSSSIIPNPKTGSNLLQGDLVEFDLATKFGFIPKGQQAMIISHSCSLTNSAIAILVPVYLESELDETAMTALRGVKPKNYIQMRGNWLSNETVNFLGLPAVHIQKSNPNGERMLACLSLQCPVETKTLPTAPSLRLNYRALSYLQLRLGMLYLRDVQDSDDTRDF